jgi:putative DNA primase/helicase
MSRADSNAWADCTMDQVQDALQFLSADESRDDWVRIGMAIKAEFGDVGFDLFNDWSMGSDKYDRKNMRGTWKSIKASGGTNIGSLFKKAMDAGYSHKNIERDNAAQAAYQKELAARKVKRDADAKAEDLWRTTMQDVVANAAKSVVAELATHEAAPCDYLSKKQIKAFGVYVAARSVLMVVNDEDCSYQVLTGENDISAFFKSGAAKLDHISVRNIKRGCLVVPIVNRELDIRSIQIIFSINKSFPRHGQKSDCFHFIGDQSCGQGVLCIAEGYATAASIFMATGYPCVVGFDAGNIVRVSKIMREVFPAVTIVVCGDDDAINKSGVSTGIEKANQAAASCAGIAVIPHFENVVEVAVNG